MEPINIEEWLDENVKYNGIYDSDEQGAYSIGDVKEKSEDDKEIENE